MIFVVADGMGGHAGGEVASRLCVEEIGHFLRTHGAMLKNSGRHHPDPRFSSLLGEAINHASLKVYEKALEEPDLKGMGTTSTMIKLVPGHAYCAHVGDSRLYLIREKFIYQITFDHSLVSEQLRAGLITREQARVHDRKNVITRSVGYQEYEDVDTASFDTQPGDILLLSSDGLHGKLTDEEISNICEMLGCDAVDSLISKANERGGEDNITAVIIKIKN
jgi:protein phosphatase